MHSTLLTYDISSHLDVLNAYSNIQVAHFLPTWYVELRFQNENSLIVLNSREAFSTVITMRARLKKQ